MRKRKIACKMLVKLSPGLGQVELPIRKPRLKKSDTESFMSGKR